MTIATTIGPKMYNLFRNLVLNILRGFSTLLVIAQQVTYIINNNKKQQLYTIVSVHQPEHASRTAAILNTHVIFCKTLSIFRWRSEPHDDSIVSH